MILHKDAFLAWLCHGNFIEMLQKQHNLPTEDLRIWVEETEDDRSAYYDCVFVEPIAFTNVTGGQPLPKIILKNNKVRRENVEEVIMFLVQSFDLSEMEAKRVMRDIS